jgi:LysR family hydrogen peroxide-inducible transcriptional activator
VSTLELRQLKYVLAVAEAGSFTQAAQNIHISQPSLSQQIRLLEKELGVELFRRGPGGVQITPAGEIAVRQARAVLRNIAGMRQELDDLNELKHGSVTIGTLPMTGGQILPPVLAAFTHSYPGIRIHLVEERTPQLLAVTLAGQTDFSLLTLPLEYEELTWEPLIEEELLLAVPVGHKLAGAGGVTLKDAAGEEFVLLKTGNGFRTVCDAKCMAAGFTPNCVFETDNIETAKALVSAGMGVTLVPELIAGITPQANTTHKQQFYRGTAGITYIRLQPAPTRTVVVAWRRDHYLSKAAHAFHRQLAEYWTQ